MLFDEIINNGNLKKEYNSKNEFVILCDYTENYIVLEKFDNVYTSPKNKNKKCIRTVLIGRSQKAGHAGRMKVSKPVINNNHMDLKNHKNTISLFVSNERTG